MSGVRAMERFAHGGDAFGLPAGAVDFSASLNPLGMPDAAARVLRSGVAQFAAYPDPRCRMLVRALADYLEVPASAIVCTAGASDLFLRLCLACKPRRVLVASPCFSGYEHAARQVGAHLERFDLDAASGFEVTHEFARRVVPGVDMVFICSPNNPTGRVVSFDVLRAVCERAQHVGAVVCIDECFVELSDGRTFLHEAQGYSCAVIARAFTKTFSLAGLRVGYGVFSDAQLARRVEASGCEWAVSTPAQLAGVACVDAAREGFVERSRAYVRAERAYLEGELARAGLCVVESQANYLLLESPVELYEPLYERGVVIRRCENFDNLGAGWYRVGVRRRKDNARLVSACKEVLS